MKRGYHYSRTAGFLLAVLCIMNLGSAPAWAAPEWPSDTGIMAQAGIAMDENTGAVLFGQNTHAAYAPASITKLLTALVVAENASLDDMVTFSHDAVYNVESGSGNALALEEGDVLSVRDCMHALLLRSSNQAANALAEHVAGSREAFVVMMNERIARIGCTESHFANPSGLNDDEQYVTAYDMALIAREAFSNDTVLEVGSARRYELPATIKNPEGLTIAMEHKLLAAQDPSSRYYLEGAVAGKTGYTSVAGNTLVTYAVRDGRGVISVILKGSQPQYYFDGKTLIEFGFASFQDIPVEGQETYLSEQGGIDRDGDHYQASELYLEEGACVTVPNGASFSDVTRTVTEELAEGHPKTALARILYTYHDRQVGSAYICANNLHISTEPLPVSILETPEEDAGEDETEDGTTGGQPAAVRTDVSYGWLIALGMIALLAAVSGVVFLLWRRRKKEQEAMALRRERRRQRLKDMGFDEEEFEKMVQERMKSGPGNRR